MTGRLLLSRAQWLALILIQWAVVIAFLVFLTLFTLSRSPDRLFEKALLPGGIIVAVMGLLVATPPLVFLTGRLRAQRLREVFPESVVLDVARTVELTAAIASTGQARATGLTLSMVVDSSTVAFWGGGWRSPAKLLQFNWADVSEFSVARRPPVGIDVGRVSFAAGASLASSFGLIGPRWFQFFPLDSASTQAAIDQAIAERRLS